MKELMNILVNERTKQWWKGLSLNDKVKCVAGMIAFCVSLFGVTAEDAPLWWYLLMVVIMGCSVAMLNSVPSEDLED